MSHQSEPNFSYDQYDFMLSRKGEESIELDEAGVLALEQIEIGEEDGARNYEPGDFVRVKKPNYIEGIAAVMSVEMFDDEIELSHVPSDLRNEGGFVFTNGAQAKIPEACYSNIELKSRFPDELRDYPEKVHVHNVPEWYFGVGAFEMWVANGNFPNDPGSLHERAREIDSQDPNALVREEPKWFEIKEFEDEAFLVEPGLYHGIRGKDESAYLGVARGNPEGRETWIGKWDLEGRQFYDHFEDEHPSLDNLACGGD